MHSIPQGYILIINLQEETPENPDTEMSNLGPDISSHRSHRTGTNGSQTNCRPAWTLAHAFYAVMGGYVVETSKPISLFGDEKRFVLNPSGVSCVIKYYPNLIPNLPALSLWDRSKTDSIAKALLIIQVLYFCASCIIRRAKDLPLSLLEITTLAHAVCALLTYFVWWCKPSNILEPTILKPSEGDVDELVARLLMESSPYREFPGGIFFLSCAPECQLLSRLRDTDVTDLNYRTVTEDDPEPMDVSAGDIVRIDDSGPYYRLSWIHHNDPWWKLRAVFGPTQRPWYVTSSDDGLTFTLSECDKSRWVLAERSKQRTCNGFQWEDRLHNRENLIQRRSALSICSSLDFASNKLLWGTPVAFSLCTALYGGFHAFGWNAHFSTHIQKVLWHVASILLPSTGLFYVSMLLIYVLNGILSCQREPSTDVNMAILFSYIPFVFVAYILASGYLFVTSILQLFDLPPDIFQQPSISSLWPHIA